MGSLNGTGILALAASSSVCRAAWVDPTAVWVRLAGDAGAAIDGTSLTVRLASGLSAKAQTSHNVPN